ncbi:MAG: DNA polymerase Y family protein, partial [Deltaproteobacteria bacterium]
FGSEAYRLQRLAAGDLERPLVAASYQEPLEGIAVLDHPATSTLHLLSIARRTLARLLDELHARQHAVVTMHALFVLDGGQHVIESLQPARPTLDGAVLLELLQLRLHGTCLPAPVGEIRLRLETAPADREQLRLLAAATRRDLQAAGRALARLRAEFGEAAVVRARLREGHLPEARFTWEPISQVERAQPRRIKVRPLVRRIYQRPLPLPPRPPSERIDNWLFDRPRLGRIERTSGPYLVSGGWWNAMVHREYHYVEVARGDVLWLYYDRCRRRWRLQGRVE